MFEMLSVWSFDDNTFQKTQSNERKEILKKSYMFLKKKPQLPSFKEKICPLKAL